MNKLYTAQEIADKLQIKKTTVYELIKRGELYSSKVGKQLRISEQQLKQYLERSGSGYVTLVRVGDRSISGIELRELLGLRSSDFDFTLQDGTFTFTTLGYGHGVGLSQYGADYLARQGSDYRAILEHYYTGASVVEREE